MKNHKTQVNKNRQGSVTAAKLVELQSHQLLVLNKIRKNHGCPALSISHHLTSLAQNYAQHLYQTNSFQHSDNLYGQNLYRTSIYWSEQYKKGRAVQAWHQQIKNYDFQKGVSKNGQMIGHFTSQIWKQVKQVGFGFYWGTSNHSPNFMIDLYVVALFNPTPNKPGEYVVNIPRPVGE